MKLALIIPSYNDAAGLWYTVAAARVDLEQDFAPDEYEIVAVVDGPEDDGKVVYGMRQQKTCRFLQSDLRTPQLNRHMGVLATDAPHLFFFDSHVVPCRGFFKRMLSTAEETGAAIVHGPHCFWRRHDKGLAYGYFLNWKHHFWAHAAEDVPKYLDRPWRICLAGHGAMCVNRKQYMEIGGYWDALRGWGGEEPQLNLKAWMLGKEVYIEPRAYHWHFMPEKRNLDAIFRSRQFVRNFMLVAYASGGQKYLDAVYAYYAMQANPRTSVRDAAENPPVDLYAGDHGSIPTEAAAERSLICSGPFGGDLDKLREFFTREGITH